MNEWMNEWMKFLACFLLKDGLKRRSHLLLLKTYSSCSRPEDSWTVHLPLGDWRIDWLWAEFNDFNVRLSATWAISILVLPCISLGYSFLILPGVWDVAPPQSVGMLGAECAWGNREIYHTLCPLESQGWHEISVVRNGMNATNLASWHCPFSIQFGHDVSTILWSFHNMLCTSSGLV